MRISIMQPYFFPYAGYFRLFAASDLFVSYDCVQFPRRSLVHRNRLTRADGQLDWFTLPIQKAPFEVTIDKLKIAADASSRMSSLLNKFPAVNEAQSNIQEQLLRLETLQPGSPASHYVENCLFACCGVLKIDHKFIRSSELNISSEIKGSDRIIEICKQLGATRYLNSPGGRQLYDAEVFDREGINLQFLQPYEGSQVSILERLCIEDSAQVAREVNTQCEVVMS